jgi:hypothetical protein
LHSITINQDKIMKRIFISVTFLLLALTGTAVAAECCGGGACCMDMPCCD